MLHVWHFFFYNEGLSVHLYMRFCLSIHPYIGLSIHPYVSWFVHFFLKLLVKSRHGSLTANNLQRDCNTTANNVQQTTCNEIWLQFYFPPYLKTQLCLKEPYSSNVNYQINALTKVLLYWKTREKENEFLCSKKYSFYSF